MRLRLKSKAPSFGLLLVILGYGVALFTLSSAILLGYSIELIGGTAISYTLVPIIFLIYYIFNYQYSNDSIYHKYIQTAIKTYLLVVLIPVSLLIFQRIS